MKADDTKLLWSMYLERVELEGFKSFTARSTVSFCPHFTVITGPNGALAGRAAVALAAALAAAEATLECDRGWLPITTDSKPGISNDPVRALESGTAANCNAGSPTVLAG